MLVALCNENRTTAALATRGSDFHCPNCRKTLVLKKGRIIVHHFAHKPIIDCEWAAGETLAHLEAKQLVFNALSNRGLRAELEFSVDTMPGDRRADVMTWSPTGRMIAIELQHTSISAEDIGARAFAYARAGIAQMWIGFLPAAALAAAKQKDDGTWIIRRYAPRQFERWIASFAPKSGCWMYEPQSGCFWLARFQKHEIHTDEAIWYSAGGIENYREGYSRDSRKFRDLILRGPLRIEDLRLVLSRRRQFANSAGNWPAGMVANMVPAQGLS